jgi:transcriptional regulator with XRE-family HTH domain
LTRYYVHNLTQSTRQQIPHLRAAREQKGFGLNETARRAGIDPAQLSRIERGLAGLTAPTLLRLARVLELRELERLLALYVDENGA